MNNNKNVNKSYNTLFILHKINRISASLCTKILMTVVCKETCEPGLSNDMFYAYIYI